MATIFTRTAARCCCRTAYRRTGSQRCASSASGSGPSAATPPPLVLYRGPPAMKPALNLLCGAIFIATGFNVSYIIANHLSWPIITTDVEKNPPKLLPLGLRYAAAMGTALLGLGSGYFFVLVPMRSVTRITIQQARSALALDAHKADKLVVRPPPAVPAGTPMVHIRTAIPSFTHLLPRALLPANLLYGLRVSGWHHPDAASLRDRVVPLDTVFRFMGRATDGVSSLDAARRKMAVAGDVGQRHRKSVMLRLGKSRIAYTLESEGGIKPSTVSPSGKPHNLYKVFWANIKHSFRGLRDDGDLSPADAASKAGPKALGAKEPWFLDRGRFDQLFPSEKHAKR